ncbi:MAG: hypothetical protein WKG07_22865 [Hymenobacter sp.]
MGGQARQAGLAQRYQEWPYGQLSVISTGYQPFGRRGWRQWNRLPADDRATWRKYRQPRQPND